MKELPQGHRYRVTGTGKIVLKEEDAFDNADSNSDTGRDPRQSLPRVNYRGRGRGRGRPVNVR